jgi:hypothetical protein
MEDGNFDRALLAETLLGLLAPGRQANSWHERAPRWSVSSRRETKPSRLSGMSMEMRAPFSMDDVVEMRAEQAQAPKRY